MTDLTWRHHAMIQALISRGPLKAVDLHKIFEGVTGRNPGAHEALFNKYITRINEDLSYIQFELRACRNQYDGEVYYGVVNNVAEEQSKLGTKYTVPQITFYKSIIEAIVQDEAGQGSISSINALNLILDFQGSLGSQSQLPSQSQGDTAYSVPATVKNFTMSQKEKTLGELVRDGWLCWTSSGNLGLGIRSFLDLRGWFRLNDVPSCVACNEAGVKVEICPNEGCTVRLHKYCLIKKFSQIKASRVCPGCGNSWPYTLTEADILRNGNEVNEQSSGPGARPERKKRNPKSELLEDDNELADAQAARGHLRKRRRSCVTTDSNVAGSSQAANDGSQTETCVVSTLRRSTRRAANVR